MDREELSECDESGEIGSDKRYKSGRRIFLRRELDAFSSRSRSFDFYHFESKRRSEFDRENSATASPCKDPGTSLSHSHLDCLGTENI
jgi:hypothetical protein